MGLLDQRENTLTIAAPTANCLTSLAVVRVTLGLAPGDLPALAWRMVCPEGSSPLIVVVGPTGAGKSSLGLRIAEEYLGEIINCDSLQFYRGFDIGTAKTPEADRRGIPHHLFDVLETKSVYSAGDYGRDARRVIEEVRDRGNLPILVGGTGFYLRAALDGLPSLPGRDEELRAKLTEREQRRPGSLHRLLQRLEPSAGARIHPSDAQKILRALEIRLLTGNDLPSSEATDALEGYGVLLIGLSPDRAKLVELIHERTATMFAEGLIAEVQQLLNDGATGEEKPFEAIGYKQVLKYLRGQTPLAEAIESTEIETRQYAKRQWTWFRRDPRVWWLEGFGNDSEIQEQAISQVRDFLP